MRMKAVVQVVQFLLFFMIGLVVFLSVGNVFRSQYDLFGQDVAGAERKLIGSVISAATISSYTCKECDNVSLQIALKNFTANFFNNVVLDQNGITVITNPSNRQDFFSMHNLNFSINQMDGIISRTGPIILTYVKAKSSLTVSSVGIQVEPSGLVGYWKLDEGDGGTAYDSSSNGNPLTIAGGTWVDGKTGKALKFGGSGYASANIGSGKITNKVTMTAWVKFLSLNGQQDFLGVWDAASNRYVAYKTSDNYIRFWSNKWDATYIPTQVSKDVWYRVAFVYDGTNERIYLDGREVSSSVQPFTLSNNQQTVYLSDGGLPLNGVIDEVRIYNRALTADEIQQLG